MPSFELHEVTLQGPDGRTALRLPHVVAAISPRSLLSFQLDFEQLLIEGAELDVRRDANGHLFVAGLDLGAPTAGGGSSAAADWFFRQREFVLRGGALRWVDEQRQAPPLTFTQVELVVRNTLRQHALRLSATPPTGWGDRFSASGRFTQPLLARRGDLRRWSGSLYASLPRADASRLRRYVALPFELSEGRGSVRTWFDIDHGEPTAATVDVALEDVVLRLDPGVEALAFARIEGRLIGRRDHEGASLEAQRFSFDAADGIHWPEGGLKLAWRQRPGHTVSGGSFSADRLDLGSMARVATRIPLGDAVRKLLADLHPQGAASAVDAHWDGPFGAPDHYRVKGRVSGLSVAAKPAALAGALGRPGLRNASLQVDTNEAGGSARLDVAGGAVDLPGVFEEPLLPLDRLDAQLLWKIEPASRTAASAPRISVQVKDGRFANADAHGEFDARWSSGTADPLGRDGHDPGRLDLDGTLADGVATRVYRYLPLSLPRATRDYVLHAVQGGRLTHAAYHIHGDLRDFPFFAVAKAGGAKRAADRLRTALAGGEFRILAQARDVSFVYVPPAPGTLLRWPMLTDASAELELDHGSFFIRNGSGRIGNVECDGVGGAIEHLERGGVLSLAFVARGPLAELLGFVDSTPVGGWIGNALEKAAATGSSELKLALGLPLTHLDAGATVKGSLALNDNDLRFAPDSPLLGSARGRVDFTEKGFSVTAAGAKVYGGDATFEGGTQADGSVRFTGQGMVTAEGLRRAPELGPVSRLAAALAGATSYRLNLGFVHARQDIGISSNLVGMAVNLPAPLAKPAEVPLALRYQTAPEPQPTNEPPLDLLRFELGDTLQARYVRELSGESPRVVQGGVGVFAAAPGPARGVAANVELATLDVDAWQAAVDKLFAAPLVGAAASPASAVAAAAATAPGDRGDSDYLPDSIALRVQELRAGGRRLSHLTAGLSHAQGAWRANLDADELAGYVEYRGLNEGSAMATGGRVFARLARLSLPKSDAVQVSTLLDSRPENVPALDVVVDDLVLNGLNLGRVEVQAANRSAGPSRDPSRDWQLTKFDITTPEAKLVGTGLWAATGVPALRTAAQPRRMVMDFTLRIDDSGALLTRLGTGNVIRGGKGELSGHVGWMGSPLALDYPSLGGQIKVAIDEGQFLKAEPGAARLLGVLSLQSLPRRLSLDFRDVFDKGFAFDAITGDLTIAGGVAETSNLRMRGVQASVSMQGSADIGQETQDLHVVVVPEVNAGTAALAYAVVNPAIGLGAFVAQALLKKPLTEAGTREFRILGPWADPKVEPVARTPSDEVPAVARAASGTAKNP